MIDTHAHLNMEPLTSEIERHIAEAKEAGVTAIIVPGVTPESSRSSIRLAQQYPGYLYGCIGVHPGHAHEASLQDFAELYESADWNLVTAVGEVGFDFYHPLAEGMDAVTRESVQRDVFIQAITYAQFYNKPLIIHTRESFDAAYILLQEYAPGYPTVIHCFTGTADELSMWLDLGCHISATGMITYPKNRLLAEVIATVPLDRLMVETDAPFLAPQGKRGQPSAPRDVIPGATLLAELKGMTVEAFDAATSETARAFFSL